MSEQNSEPSAPFDPPVPPTAPPAPPQAPPAPPTAPPERPEVPKYGEYAPAGSTPTYGAPVTPPNPYGVPTTGAAAPATPPATPPAAPEYAAAPQYGAPQYGTPQYGTPQYGAPVYGAPAYAPAVRTRKTWDVVLTVILLILGLFGMGFGLIYAWLFTQPDLFRQAMASQGLGTFSGSFGSASTVIAVSHVALFVVAAALSIALLVRGRIRVFWIPLVAGVVAAAIFWVTLISVFASDPGFLSRYGG